MTTPHTGDIDTPSSARLNLDEDRFVNLRFKANEVFTPSAPIDQKRLFAGRIEQMQKIIDAISSPGQHAVIYGERGVGKTSLVKVVSNILLGRRLAIRVNCFADDNFSSVWSRAFHQILIPKKEAVPGFNREDKTVQQRLTQILGSDVSIDKVVQVLTDLRNSVFIFDEFDQLKNKEVPGLFANLIKAISDDAVHATIILVGVADSVGQLLDSHASVERALKQILMPRMTHSELVEIIQKAEEALGVSFSGDTYLRVVRISQGLPHYVHSLGLSSVHHSFSAGRVTVDDEDVDAGIIDSVNNIEQSILDSYMNAVGTPQKRKKTLFKDVLLACALTQPDERGYFSAADVRESLSLMGTPMQIPVFAGHLNSFASKERDNILQKTGTPRKYRYRFGTPLMQPFILMKGIADGLVTSTIVDSAMKEHAQQPKGRR